MILNKIILFLLFTLFGLQLFFQNADGLVHKFIELRQSYIIEKTNCKTTFVFSKKEYLLLKGTKEIIVDNIYYDIKKVDHLKNTIKLFVIEDKNESFVKYLSYSLKKEKSKKNKAKLKRGITLSLTFQEEIKNNFITIDGRQNNFYFEQNKNIKVVIPILKPPIV
ncbi:hypothetical protein [Flavobacterium sp.]|jgi:hypothetical protein|uniref:hypothetical protein n=1 Tax=Flavobacterium sp. TaxID=239 RepID=UPI002A80027A|nr:hypothetical protein [Flavobacterium sp.]